MKRFDDVKWVWFDLDDTLIDFHTNSRAANRSIHATEGLDQYYPDQEEWINLYEAHNRILWERYGEGKISQDFLRIDRFAYLLREHWQEDTESLVNFCRHLDREYLDRLAKETALIDGAREILCYLRSRNYNIGVLSNGFKDVQHSKLAHTHLDEMIDLVVLSDDIGINKPDIRLYEYAMSQAGEPDALRHLMVGDNLTTDIAGAIGARWKAIQLLPHSSSLKKHPEGYLSIPKLSLLKECL